MMDVKLPYAPWHAGNRLVGADGSLMGNRIASPARTRFAVGQALAQDRVGFYFQPVVGAGRRDFPAFYEMLARLTLPSGQMIAAGAFMPFVEESELGRAIDRLVLARALDALAANPRLRLSVNISPLSMGDGEWLATLQAAARADAAVTARLIIEITETAAIIDVAQTIDFMQHVQGLGPAFALDDFGAGATGFRHFRDFRFDMVKIDGDFIQGVADSRDRQVLVECLVAVAKHFEMFTIGERVESEADAAWLAQHGIDCLQGYLIGRPLPQPALPGCEGVSHAAVG